MNDVYLTIGTGPRVEMACRFADLFQDANRVPVRVIADADISGLPVRPSEHWIKAYLWDFVPPSTKRICYMDSDILPRSPLGKLPNAPFSAVAEPGGAEWEKKHGHGATVSGIKNYFNAGVFVCTRESIPVFEALKLHDFLKTDQSIMYEQTWMNHFVQIILGGWNPLPSSWNWLLYDNKYEPGLDSDIKMVHFIFDYEKKQAEYWQKNALKCHGGQLGMYEKRLLQACAEEPLQRETWTELANFYKYQLDWPGMYYASTQALKCEYSHQSYLDDGGAWGILAHEQAAISALRLGLNDQAHRYADDALKLGPSEPRLINLARKCSAANDSDIKKLKPALPETRTHYSSGPAPA